MRVLHARLRGVDDRTARAQPRPRPTSEIREGLSGNLCRCTGYQGIISAVRPRLRSRSARAHDRRRRAAARFIGQSVHRKEDRRLLTGHGLYVDDVVLPGHAARRLLAQRGGQGDDRRLDVDRRQAARRRRRRLHRGRTSTGATARRGTRCSATRCRSRRRSPATDVRHVGEPIAVVVAENRYVAEDALRADRARPRPAPTRRRLRHRGRRHRARRARRVGLPDERDGRGAVHADVARSRRRLRLAPSTSSECDDPQNRYVCVPMEGRGHRCVAGPPAATSSTSCARARACTRPRNFFARYLRRPRGHDPRAAATSAAASGRRCSCSARSARSSLASPAARPAGQVDRGPPREPHRGGPRSQRAGHGAPRPRRRRHDPGITVEHVADVGAYPPCPAVMRPRTLLARARTRSPASGSRTAMVWTNTMGKGAYRGPWMFETTAREMVIDHAARELGIDPVELRRRNLLVPADLPFTSPAARRSRRSRRWRRSSRRSRCSTTTRSARSRPRRAPRAGCSGSASRRTSSRRRWPRRRSRTEGATVRVEAAARSPPSSARRRHGQSVETTMAQIVADTLGVDYRRRHRRPGRHAVDALRAGHRRQPDRGGRRRCGARGRRGRAREGRRRSPPTRWRRRPRTSTIADGVVSVRGTPSRAMSSRTSPPPPTGPPRRCRPSCRAGTGGDGPLPADRVPDVVERHPRAASSRSTATRASPQMLRYIVSEDCGRMINPMVVEGQISGGVVQGIGGVLLEHFVYDDDGNPLTTTFMDYLLPTTTEVPDDRDRPHRDAVDDEPRRLQGHGRGRRHRRPRGGRQRRRRRPRPPRDRRPATPLGPNDIHRLLVEAGAAT